MTPVDVWASRPSDYVAAINNTFTVQNLSGQVITAFQATYTTATTDALGRSTQIRVLLDCTTAPLQPGETRNGSKRFPTIRNSESSEQAFEIVNLMSDGASACTYRERTVSRINSEFVAVFKALEEGVPGQVTITVNRVTFGDGSGLGAAVPGS